MGEEWLGEVKSDGGMRWRASYLADGASWLAVMIGICGDSQRLHGRATDSGRRVGTSPAGLSPAPYPLQLVASVQQAELRTACNDL